MNGNELRQGVSAGGGAGNISRIFHANDICQCLDIELISENAINLWMKAMPSPAGISNIFS